MTTYLFYDVETSGLNPAFDQILTFACIRTDVRLNEIERETITIRLRDDIVPSPGAFLTHGLTSDELDMGIDEYFAALEIHKLFNLKGTISIGYNSLGFDDEFLRFLFYRNLLDPYSHQYYQGCSRADILPVTAVYRVFHPETLLWPENNGKPSLKLDLIAKQNKFIVSGRAHEAMSDVEALILLSKRLSENESIWKYCLAFFNKTRDEVRINDFKETMTISGKNYLLGIMISASFGSVQNYMAPVLFVGNSSVYKNQSLWLRLDEPDILGIEKECEISETWVIRKRFGDEKIILPMFDRFLKKMSNQVLEKLEENKNEILKNEKRFEAYAHFHKWFKYPHQPEMDIDASLYQDGFFSKNEKKQAEMVHACIQNRDFKIPDKIISPRVRELCKRILGRNFRGDIDKDIVESFEGIKKAVWAMNDSIRIAGYKNDRKLTFLDATMEFRKAKKELANPDNHQRKVLSWLNEYFNRSGVSSA